MPATKISQPKRIYASGIAGLLVVLLALFLFKVEDPYRVGLLLAAGCKSSNGKMLFEECRRANPNTLFISDACEITEPLPQGVVKVGVCGATSTPKWQMEQVAERVKMLNHSR